jgi:hypothetical protein
VVVVIHLRTVDRMNNVRKSIGVAEFIYVTDEYDLMKQGTEMARHHGVQHVNTVTS